MYEEAMIIEPMPVSYTIYIYIYILILHRLCRTWDGTLLIRQTIQPSEELSRSLISGLSTCQMMVGMNCTSNVMSTNLHFFIFTEEEDDGYK